MYLAKDLEFLADELAAAGNEVYLMNSSSINHAPGSLWRFLPLSEEGKVITVTDTDRLGELENDLARTRMMAKTDAGSWRVPIPNDLTVEMKVCYLPFIACQFGVKGGLLEVVELLKAFTWQCLRGAVEHTVMMPNCGPLPLRLHTWPDYGFDELFLAVAAYPRLAQDGMMTFIPGASASQLMSLDIEYVTWGNPASEVIYFPSGSCCGQSEQATSSAPILEEPTEKRCTNPKIAFIFPERRDLAHPEVWAEYLGNTHNGAVFTVASDGDQEGELAVLQESHALMQKAMESQDWTHFIILPGDAVPTRGFAQLRRSFQLDARSRMTLRSWEDERKTNVLRAQQVENLTNIRREHAHFHSPWIALSLEDAELLCSTDLTVSFAACASPGQCYFATALSVLGKPPLQNVATRSLTWTPDKNRHGSSDNHYEIAPSTIATIIDSGCFFATGFPVGSSIGNYQLHHPT
ncbi:MAG: beta-1,6-N-acetylglucosaminyltransferase [Akkermansiaceae bacterium]